MSFVPVAIVGRACVLPGALTPEALWERVLAGDDLTSSAPPGRWDLAPEHALTDDPARAVDRAWSDRGGYVHGFESVWDPSGFAVPAERLAGLDPLFHWVLHTGRQALDGVRGSRARAGLVLGNLSFPTHGMARHAESVWLGAADPSWPVRTGRDRVDARDRFMSGLPAHLGAEALGLGLGGFALDAACASTLYALALACDRLATGEADLMLAGAVNRADDLFLHVGFCALQALSRTGRSRPFHAEADGLLPAEGCAMFALKRLDDALRDGDPIHGVIRGIGLANDGRTGGLLAPSSEGQVRAIRAAWQQAGLDPATVGLVECHATGTPVGDKVELASLREVFGAAADVPIGSVKSNLGHPITAAGGAGLLKVLGALAAGVRPPTRGVDRPVDAVAGPLRLLTAPEPWNGPRRAALSAFGFGGNDAHLVVEAWEGQRVAAPVAPLPAPIAIVAVGARVGDAGTEALSALARGEAVDGHATRVRVRLDGLRFPPKDLEQTLPQQLLVLETAREVAGALGPLPRNTTGVLVGIGTDAEIARWGLRWRLAELAPVLGWDGPTLARARDAVVPKLEAAGVVGTMPNIPANRVQATLDLAGPGFTVSSEERSGLDALATAVRLLRRGTLDVALVGAVDLSDEPVHQAALASLGRAEPTADAAVVVALMRLDDARRDGRPVLAVLDEGEAPEAPAPRVGKAHAADGLLRVAVAVTALAASERPAEQRVAVTVSPLGGLPERVVLRGADRAPVGAGGGMAGERTIELRAHWAPVELPRGAGVTVMPPAPWLPPILDDVPVQPVAPRAAAAPATAVSPSVPVVTPTPAASPRPAAPATPVVPSAPASRVVTPPPVVAPSAPVTPVAGARPTVLAALAEEARRVSEAHTAFLARQREIHERFLAARRQATELLLARPGARPGVAAAAPASRPAPAPVTTRAPAPAVAAPPIPTPPPAPAVAAPPTPPAAAAVPTPVRPTTAPAAPKVSPIPAPTAAPESASTATSPKRTALLPASALPGPKLDREGLKIHASGRISEIFGPAFARQDGYERQVRMPEPPLLLADRLLGIDAEPGVLGKGVLWTETDVGSQTWYLHQDRMPAGLMIESGQADLMLISWMGIDWLNRSERVYRLLGCTLTYRDGLPKRGETLRYEIHIDGHAKHGDVRLMFFHYDCVDQDGRPRLEVRGGQAGFFTDAELADSDGILWKPETGEHDATARLDPPAVVCTRRTFDRAAIEAFAAGDAWTCFGPGFELAATHTDTPRIQPPPMLFFTEVSDLDPKGGPWGRGYLKASWQVRPDDWFFEGHFKNDPCMPGTLMFEGCLQALAFYLASLGYTLPRDGWRFEPVPDNPIEMRCRGQVRPTAKLLTYEIFVEEVHDGPIPTIYADLLCTVDGLKAFHARRCGLRLVPAWPLDHLREKWVDGSPDPEPVAEVDGHRFGWRSMLACAWGRPTEAFGPMYARFDSERKVPRLPGPPYHFLTRATRIDGPMGGMKTGSSVEVAYDVPPDAWYFATGAHRKMPFAVLLEAALQPCGWLASYVGCALQVDEDLFFRNLDGTGTVHRDVLPGDGTLRTKVKLTQLSKSGGMILVGFDVATTLDDGTPVYDMKTVFGFFPAAALAEQKGLPADAAAKAALAEPCDFSVEFADRPARWFAGPLRMPEEPLLLLDRISGYWPEGGPAGLGRIRAENDIRPDDWFFKAHFFQDPVQPGSLGIEAMIQALQWWAIENGLGDGLRAPTFEPIATGGTVTWKYRGQVRPWNRRVTVDVRITAREGRTVVADADLWVDGMRIYSATGLALRVVEGGDDPEPVERLDPAVDTWVGDHRPTWTAPALPLMSMVDRLAAAALRARPGATVAAVEDVAVQGWVVVDGPTRLRATAAGAGDVLDARLEVERDGTWRTAATGRVRLGAPGPAPAPWPTLDGDADPDPYETGTLFHGPAFRYLTRLVTTSDGASAVLDAGRGTVPWGALGQGLLDAGTHPIPHDGMARWNPTIAADTAAYPLRVDHLRLYRPFPRTGALRVEARFDGMVDARRPATRVQWIDHAGVVAELRLVEILVPKGPLGTLPPETRLAFLRDRRFVEGAALSRADGEATVLHPATVAASDWLPGTVAAIYGATTGDVLTEVAVRDHAAARFGVHPSALRLDARGVTAPSLPLNRLVPTVRREDGAVRVTGEPRLDLSPVEAWWRDWFRLGAWPVEDLYYALVERFVGRVVVEDPAALEVVRGRPVLYVGNHQTAVESLLFSVVASGLLGLPTVTIAKAEHRGTWLGRLIAHCFAYPGAKDPRVITFFDREDKEDLQRILGELAQEMAAGERSVMVHVEGTRSFECRTPVIKMSGALLDMAIAVGAWVVPVRFTGGLPVEPLAVRTEFPVGLGRQDVHLGRPISPEELAAMPYKPRKERVIAAINGLWPNATEVPLPDDPEMVEAAAAWQAARGVTAEHAVVWETLRRSARRGCPDTVRLVEAIEAGRPVAGDGPVDVWLQELARRLGGC